MSIDLALKLNRIGRPRVLVIGDLIVDADLHGRVDRLSPEGTGLPVFRVERREKRLGGAGAVAEMVQGLGGYQGYIAGEPVSRKTRMFLDGRPYGPRIDDDEQADPQGELLERIAECVPRALCVLVSDYGKGTCSKAVLRAVIDGAKKAGVPVIVDPHGSRWSKYYGCTAIKCNAHEWADDDVCDNSERLIRTVGENGMFVISAGARTEHFAARSRKVTDVTGAGDMVLACLGVCIASGLSWGDACQIANAAAGVKVTKHGAVPICRAEVIVDLLHGQKIIPVELLGAVATARRSEKIVLTNGCFDLAPHAGHLHLLREAKALGTLIVAVNDDQSVRALKGPSRPFVPLEQRMAAVAAMECVDYVVPFGSEEELEQICKDVRPDVLCKGGSYAGRHLTGEQYTKEVKLVPLVEGQSTTALIQQLQSAAG